MSAPGPMQPPPAGLLLAEAFSVRVATTKAREASGAEVEMLAALLTVRGHTNGTTEQVTITAALSTEGAAKLCGTLLEALDRMRETPGAAPD